MESELNSTFSGKGAFWQSVQQTNPKFGYIRDVTNASKHVKIGGTGHPPPSTGMTHIANTHIVSTGYGQLRAEMLEAAMTEPYESTEYQGMVDFHWSAANLPEAKRLAEALKGAARRSELVLLHIMSRVDGVDSISIKDERRTKH